MTGGKYAVFLDIDGTLTIAEGHASLTNDDTRLFEVIY